MESRLVHSNIFYRSTSDQCINFYENFPHNICLLFICSHNNKQMNLKPMSQAITALQLQINDAKKLTNQPTINRLDFPRIIHIWAVQLHVKIAGYKGLAGHNKSHYSRQNVASQPISLKKNLASHHVESFKYFRSTL